MYIGLTDQREKHERVVRFALPDLALNVTVTGSDCLFNDLSSLTTSIENIKKIKRMKRN